MPTNRLKPQYRRPRPRYLGEAMLQRPILPPPNQFLVRPIVPASPTNLTLPIPSPHLYRDNYHHPAYPFMLAPLNRIVTPATHPLRFPHPLGPLPAYAYNLLGVSLHDKLYVDRHPERRFTKWLLWYLEINDFLLRMICPSDLNNAPCEWDELQGGCGMLRLCSQKADWAHPHLGYLPTKCDCDELAARMNPIYRGVNGEEDEIASARSQHRYNCLYLHDIEPTCRGITKELYRPLDPEDGETEHEITMNHNQTLNTRDPANNHKFERQFCTYQQCPQIAKEQFCWWGHDLESARIEAVFRYFEHRAEARQRGSKGMIKTDRKGRKLWNVVRPVVGSLKGQRTFHGCYASTYEGQGTRASIAGTTTG